MKIKNSLFIIGTVCLVMAASGVSAQNPIKFGLKAGIQTRSIGDFKNISLGDMKWLSHDNTFGWQVGAMSRISVLGFFAQPELVYSSNSFRIRTEKGNSRVTLQEFEVPLLVGTKFTFVNIFAGPVFNLMCETRTKSNDAGLDIKFDKGAAGFQIGAGVTLGSLNLDLRFCGQFRNPEQILTGEPLVGGPAIGSTTVSSSMNAWQLNVGYFF